MVILTLITDVFTIAEEISIITQDTVGKILPFLHRFLEGVIMTIPIMFTKHLKSTKTNG